MACEHQFGGIPKHCQKCGARPSPDWYVRRARAAINDAFETMYNVGGTGATYSHCSRADRELAELARLLEAAPTKEEA